MPYGWWATRGSNSAVECQLPKLNVAGSIPVSRSTTRCVGWEVVLPGESIHVLLGPLGGRRESADQKPEAASAPATGGLPADIALDAVILTDPKGRIAYVNDVAGQIFFREPDDMKGRPISEFVIGLVPDVLCFAASREREGRTLLTGLGNRGDGSSVPLDIRVSAAGAGGGLAEQFRLVLRESESRRCPEDVPGVAEARLARAERLEMAGTVAGQIAHDFNNLLTPLLAYPELIRHGLPPNSAVLDYVDIMEKTANDMSHLTQQLLSLSRRGRLGDEMFSMNDVAREVIARLQPVAPAGITIEFDLAENLLQVRGGRDQMVRVVQNLCQNALDAMPGGGTLSIRTENVYLDAPFGQYDEVRVGEYVKVSVGDTGGGIPDEIKDRVFDPFFTTKHGSEKRGSGLGLSIVHGIVKDHGGYVDLTTKVGQGTIFFVYIPICRDVEEQTTPALPRGHERILVVDDDKPQVQVMVSLLERLGYRVTGVRTGEEAVRLVRDERRPFDLILLDMIMEEGMDGLETFVEIRKAAPAQRVLLMSGFSWAARKIEAAQKMGAGAYLHKPLTIETVATAVRQELDAAKKGRGGQARLLIADDERMIRKLFGMVVSAEFPSLAVDYAEDGAKAVEMFRRHRHSLIIMDLQMPVLDGREVHAEIIRLCEQNGWKEPAVIYCTGFAPPESLTDIIGRQEVHCLLRKPVKAETLVAAVRARL